jgi:hypothetical protein
MQPYLEALKSIGRFIFFRSNSQELAEFNIRYLLLGFVLVWLAGVGRHWDDAQASAAQSSGIGSLFYVIVLAGYLWLFLWPLAPGKWNYLQVLTVICMTAPPAFLYAIPIERWMNLEMSHTVNLTALGIVAVWRVALFIYYLVYGAKFSLWHSIVGVLFPLSIIILVAGGLTMAANIADSMAGTRAPQSDPVMSVTGFMVTLSFFAFLPLMLAEVPPFP